MSFDIFVESFGETQAAGLAKSTVRELFPVIEEGTDPTYWRVHYDSQNWCDIYPNVMESAPDRISDFPSTALAAIKDYGKHC